MTWTIIDQKLTAKFRLKNFRSAIDFVNKIAQQAEQLNHHPDILIYDYKLVKIQLITHSKSAITKKDYELSEQISVIFENEFGSNPS